MNFGDMSFQDYFLSGTSNNNLAYYSFLVYELFSLNLKKI